MIYFWTPVLDVFQLCKILVIGDRIDVPTSKYGEVIRTIRLVHPNFDYLFNGGEIIIYQI